MCFGKEDILVRLNFLFTNFKVRFAEIDKKGPNCRILSVLKAKNVLQCQMSKVKRQSQFIDCCLA